MSLIRQTILRGFTLVELLVVIAIIAFLASLLLGLFGGANEHVLKTNSSEVMKKVETALQQYQNDFEHFPISDYTTANGPQDQWSNKLAWYLCHKMQGSELSDAKAAASAAKTASQASSSYADPIDTSHTYTADEFRGTDPDWPASRQDKVRVEIKEHIADRAYNFELRKHLRGEYITTNELGKEFINGDAITDAFSANDGPGENLIYVVFEAKPTKGSRPGGLSDENLPVICKRIERETIDDTNNDGSIDEDEAAATDIRTHGFPGFEGKFELWSAGLDAQFHAIRGNTVNDDNHSITPYRIAEKETPY